jgi:hypothetical protein
MESVWLSVPVALFASGAEAPTDVRQDVFEGGLVVEWRSKEIVVDEEGERIIFSNGVVARYDVTTVHAERLTLLLGDESRRAIAEGEVRIIDMDGTAHASQFEFDWMNGRGSAQVVELESHGVLIRANRLQIEPNRWQAFDVYATPCAEERTPLFHLQARSLTVRPGVSASASRPTFGLFGRNLVTLPSYRFGFGARRQGFRLPGVSFSQGRLGVRWSSQFLLDPRTVLEAGARFQQREHPGGRIELTRGIGPQPGGGVALSPRTDLEERFTYGYFDHVGVHSPLQEREYLDQPRTSISAGAAWNETTVGRRNDAVFTKPLEFVLEHALSARGVQLEGQVRYQTIRRQSEGMHGRLMGQFVALLPSYELRPGLATHVRFDAAVYRNPGSNFGWGAAQIGLIYQASPHIRLGAAYVAGAERGSPLFEQDSLFSRGAYHLRGDFDWRTTRLSVLGKYDVGRRSLYGYEVAVAQAIGCIEPFVAFRSFPRSFSFGIRLRLDDLEEAIRRRTMGGPQSQRSGAGGGASKTRSAAPPHTHSPPLDRAGFRLYP